MANQAQAEIARINPIRYRGYYFDWSTGLFYLQSRYYCPSLRRFISADIYVDTGVGILGTNPYIYCNNDPVNHWDPTGTVTRPINAPFGPLTHADWLSQQNTTVAAPPMMGSFRFPNTAPPGSRIPHPDGNSFRDYGSDWFPTRDHHRGHGPPNPNQPHRNPHDHVWGRDADGNPVYNPEHLPPSEPGLFDNFSWEWTPPLIVVIGMQAIESIGDWLFPNQVGGGFVQDPLGFPMPPTSDPILRIFPFLARDW